LYDANTASNAETEFVKVFQQRELPTDMPTFAMTSAMPIIDLMVAAQTVTSRGEARRLIEQRGVRLDDVVVEKIDAQIPAHPAVLRVGRRKFVQLTT